MCLYAQTTVDYSVFARFRGGAMLRRYACCPEEPGLVMQDSGAPEPWEKEVANEYSGIQPRGIAAALRLPGFVDDESWDTETEVEV